MAARWWILTDPRTRREKTDDLRLIEILCITDILFIIIISFNRFNIA